jgi:hypothetical protein
VGRKDYKKWTKIKATVKNNMKTQYTKQIQRSQQMHDACSVITVVRLLDALESALDPPKFGDAIILFPNDNVILNDGSGDSSKRKRKEHEKKLTRKETVDQIITFFATSALYLTSSCPDLE